MNTQTVKTSAITGETIPADSLRESVAGSIRKVETIQDVYGLIWDARAAAWNAHYNNDKLVPLSHDRLLRAIEQLGFALNIISGKSTKTEIA